MNSTCTFSLICQHKHTITHLPSLPTRWHTAAIASDCYTLTSPSLITNSNRALGCFSFDLPDCAMVRFCLQFTSSSCRPCRQEMPHPQGHCAPLPAWGRKWMSVVSLLSLCLVKTILESQLESAVTSSSWSEILAPYGYLFLS